MKEIFVAHEMAPGFIEELRDAIGRFEAAIRKHTDKKGLRVAATASIDAMDKAMNAVYRLAGIVPNKLRKDYPTLKEWELARRVHNARVSKSPEPESESESSQVGASAGHRWRRDGGMNVAGPRASTLFQ